MTKNFATVSLAVLAIFASSGAIAADINGGSSFKDGPTSSSVAVVNWSGFYLGGQAGYGKAQHDIHVREFGGGSPEFPGVPGTPEIPGTPEVAAVPASCSEGKLNDEGTGCKKEGAVFTPGTAAIPAIPAIPATPGIPAIPAVEAVQLGAIGLDGIGGDGFIGGGRLGYDFAMGRFLIGVFGDYSFSNIESTAGISGGGTGIEYSLEKESEWTVGARAGILVAPRTLAYILAGYTQTDYSISGPGVVAFPGFDPDKTLSGVTVGAGVEYALGRNVFLGLEGQYTKYDTETWLDGRDEFGNGTKVDVDTDELKVLGTVKIKLNSGLPSFID